MIKLFSPTSILISMLVIFLLIVWHSVLFFSASLPFSFFISLSLSPCLSFFLFRCYLFLEVSSLTRELCRWCIYIYIPLNSVNSHSQYLTPKVFFPSIPLAFCYFKSNHSKFFQEIPSSSVSSPPTLICGGFQHHNGKHSEKAEAFTPHCIGIALLCRGANQVP